MHKPQAHTPSPSYSRLHPKISSIFLVLLILAHKFMVIIDPLLRFVAFAMGADGGLLSELIGLEVLVFIRDVVLACQEAPGLPLGLGLPASDLWWQV